MSRRFRRVLPTTILLLLVAVVGSLSPRSGWAWADQTDPSDPPSAPPDVTRLLAEAQGSGQEQGAAARLTVTSLTGVLGPGSVPGGANGEAPTDLQIRVAVENTGDEPLANLRLVVETYRPLGSRSQLRNVIDGGNTTTPRVIEEVSIRDGDELAPGEIAGAVVTIAGTRLLFRQSGGVYPVSVSVGRGLTVLDRAVTGVVYLTETPVAPLQTVMVWPLDAPPWRGTEGLYQNGVDASILPGGRLERLVRALEIHPEVRVLVAAAPHLLEALADRADGFAETYEGSDGQRHERMLAADHDVSQRAGQFLERLRATLTRTQLAPVVSAYADADLSGMVEGPVDLVARASEAAIQGRRRFVDLIGRQSDPSAWLSATPPTSRELDIVPGEHLLLSWGHVEGPPLDQNPDLPYALREVRADSGRQLAATVADPRLEELFRRSQEAPHGPALGTQRILAETAMIFFELPGTPGRPLLLRPPLDWNPHPRIPERLLDGLGTATWLRLVSPATQLTEANEAPIDAVLTGMAPLAAEDLFTELRDTSEDLTALAGALPDDASPADGRSISSLDDQLQLAASSWFTRDDVAAGEALIRDVQDVIDRSFGTVEVPTSARVTLTSESGEIPVTIQRTSGGPLVVEIRVTSTGSLTWAPGEQVERVTLAGGGAQTISFRTQARSRGLIPVTITVTDPSGRRELARTQMSVRSTAISQPALIVIALVVVGLLLTAALRRRRPPRPKLQVVGGDETARR